MTRIVHNVFDQLGYCPSEVSDTMYEACRSGNIANVQDVYCVEHRIENDIAVEHMRRWLCEPEDTPPPPDEFPKRLIPKAR